MKYDNGKTSNSPHEHDNKMVHDMEDVKKLGYEMEHIKNDEELKLKAKGKVPDPQETDAEVKGFNNEREKQKP